MAASTPSTLSLIAVPSSSCSRSSFAPASLPPWLGKSAFASFPRLSSRLQLLHSSLVSLALGFPSPRMGELEVGVLLQTEHYRLKHSSRLSCYAVSDSGSMNNPAFVEADEPVPMPVVLIDQDSDTTATVVELSFGDRLGALLDTMKALKDLGLDVAKGSVTTGASVLRTKFFITRSDTGRKVENPDMIEAIRLTIIRNLLKYHPESSQRLAMGETFGIKAPEKKLDPDIATHIMISDDGPKRSLLSIETADKPGLLTEMIQIMNDISVTVESAEIDTEGLVAKDKFHVSYHGQALSKSLAEVLTNCLRFHLRRPQSEDDSY